MYFLSEMNPKFRAFSKDMERNLPPACIQPRALIFPEEKYLGESSSPIYFEGRGRLYTGYLKLSKLTVFGTTLSKFLDNYR